jgi:surface polysaccharide O-acyltransferase-like enzyme
MRVGSLRSVLSALPGHLISPSRGLFIYSPVFLFAICGMFLKKKKNQWKNLDSLLLGIIFFHWILISLFPMWWGGHSYGPRYFSDLIPYFIYFTVPFIGALFGSEIRKKVVPLTCFLVLLFFSFFVHLRGATAQEVYRWNFDPTNIDLNPGRVWDCKDIQFLRGITLRHPTSPN